MIHNIFDHELIKKNLVHLKNKVEKPYDLHLTGTIVRSVGLTLEARGIEAPIGTICYVINEKNEEIESIVTGFSGDTIYLMPIAEPVGIEAGSRIYSTGKGFTIPVSNELLGRVIDGAGKSLDGKKPIKPKSFRGLNEDPINPLDRDVIDTPLDVGVCAINSLLTIGQGQRIGLFAGSGVGKSVLLGMMAKYTSADITVVGLIGERGREVKEFIEQNLGDEGLKRSVVVASPADYSPLLRYQGALIAMSIAEYFRDQGKNVLLLMDSLTRFAQARREIALSMGEPPATKGYPPSVFAALPQLVERAGNGVKGKGSITGLFTVLAEGDDQQDPVVDSARAILDGHIVLTRQLADIGHYPAIDVESSVSRVMNSIVSTEHKKAALRLKRFYALYRENKDLINIGAYVSGNNPDLDYAIENIDTINGFLQQDTDEAVSIQEGLDKLYPIVEGADASSKAIQTINE